MIISGLAVGVALGAVMQRGRFCVTGMLRDIFLQRSWRTMAALFILISVHAVGIAALTGVGIIAPEVDPFAPAAVVLGSFVFGLGIILAGGCASGTWYRSAEGLVGSWIALAMYGLSAAAMKNGALTWLNDGLRAYTVPLTTIPESLGVSPWWFVLALCAGTVVMVRHFLAQDAARPRVATLDRPATKRPLNVYVAGALIGLIGVIAWPLSAAAGRNDGLGITTPTSDIVTFAVTGDPARLNWGVMLVLGLLLGAFAAAKYTGEFRVRVPDARTTVRSVFGGLAMGVGASLAGGCTVGNGMVQTSLFSYQGWVALVFIALGVAVGTRLWLKPSGRAGGAPAGAAAYSTEDSLAGARPAPDEAGVAAPTFQTAVGLIEVADGPGHAGARRIGENRYALDTLGAVCPFPLIEAKDVMDTLAEGDELVIDFDCTQATDSIPQWASTDGHAVIDFRQRGDAGWQITLRKGGARQPAN